ncbi:MAG: circularly permuted type 2 ATP-grasp protein [Curvibacter lanceolatus]|uniref:circularly permuted type 2 ATP-grasp protein n=1 Tax=Curvibacter lanceolatus TaxID=86182 RepID=UPI00036C0080|nr:circularly permuted type 2 ATP-grasp protein [Curvibacter lanceolatus]MBV5290988.1 circularly permuted type 2 ATP-grasp protein [Curvibacter lanceolatus]
MEPTSPLSSETADTRPPLQAGDLVLPATSGHYDELRGEEAQAAQSIEVDDDAPPPGFTGPWSDFFKHLGSEGLADLDHREASLKRQIRDNGVTYNVYADASGPQRPWSLDLFPLIINPESWQQIEAGVLQRVRVLDRVMADVYGPQHLLSSGLLPAALVQGHPGYLRAMKGVKPVGGSHLHIAAFDLARGPDGNWWVVSQRTQAPSGLGYLLENRLAVSRQFPQAFEAMQVQRLAATYRALIEGLKAMSPAGADSHIALLTPGPYNETYFEHAYLARYLGLTLVEGSDLTVRDQRLYLKTLQGLKPVHGLLKRLDDEFLDPLELRPDSTLGVPGLLQAIRAGNVLVANTPGSAFLESPALLGFLPALARHLLNEELLLPALPTWWCGERAALEDALPLLGESVIKPTYAASAGRHWFESVSGPTLSQRQLDEWAGRILRQSDEHTVQQRLPLSQIPVWRQVKGEGRLARRSVMLRVFAVADGPASWRVLPGGMARIASANAEIASMQRGGSSADVWVQTEGRVDSTSLLNPHPGVAAVVQRKRLVTSRAAENLFWLGRYTERTENTLRLARLTLACLNGDDQSAQPLLAWLSDMAVLGGLVLPSVPPATQARRVFERSLIDGLDKTSHASSVGFNLRALRHSASAVRERLSQEHWNVITQAEEEFFSRCKAAASTGAVGSADALQTLEITSGHLAAITGAQTDRMTRDDGWRLLSIGRHIERLAFLASALSLGLKAGALHDDAGFEATLALFDSTITFHAQFQQSRELPALLDLLVMDRDNPRSLAWVAQTLRGRLARLAGSAPGQLSTLSLLIPNPDIWSLEQLCGDEGRQEPSDTQPPLAELLALCTGAAYNISDEISAQYFTHSGEARQSLGA